MNIHPSGTTPFNFNTLPWLVKILMVLAISCFGGWASYGFGLLEGGVTLAVYLPQGIALAALLLGGRTLWPALVIGEVVTGYIGTGDWAWQSTFSTLANVGGVYLVAVLLERFQKPFFISTIKHFNRFVLATALISEQLSATVGTGYLYFSHQIELGNIFSTWFGWWFSNVLGQWFVVPSALILVGGLWSDSAKLKEWPKSLLAVFLVVFLGSFASGFWGTELYNPQMVYLILPLIIFISVRLGQVASSLATLIMVGLLNIATLRHIGPFTGSDMNTRLIDLNFFLAAMSLSTLFINVVFSERQTLIDALERKSGELEQAATTDSLTKVLNRRGFYALMDDRSQAQSGTVLMVDIDHFKRLNDVYGHSRGDEILQQVADTLKESLRTDDLLARFGGEEFIIVLPKTSLEQSQQTAERLRVAVEQQCQVTISLGVTQIQATESLEVAINRADELMYQSKNQGRNRVSSA